MTDSLERFLQDLRFEVPAGMVDRARAAASDAAGARQPMRVRVHYRGGVDTTKQSWAPAMVAVLLAVAIVATLLFVAHQRQAVPAHPEPHRATPYTIPSPPSVAPGCSSVPRQWAGSPPRPAKMLSATTGWAYGPMRTTDGGANWLDVSPPSIPNRTVKNDEYFLDATHAWVAETASSPKSCVDHVVIFKTVDAGRTWQQAAPIPVRFAAPTDLIWTGEFNHTSWFSFVDAQNGWLLLGSGPVNPYVASGGVNAAWVGAVWRVGDLYRTTDGGLHWTLAATNPGSGADCIPATPSVGLHESVMSFSSLTTGWMFATCGLLGTRDGGVTWVKSATPLVPRETPVFFDQRHGLIFADGGVLATSDGGTTWSVRALPSGLGPIEFINPSEGWAVAVGDKPFQCSLNDLRPCSHNFRLYHTSDGGKTWVPGNFTSLVMPAPKFWPPAYLHFVDSNIGFIDPGGDPADTAHELSGLFKTTDGGSTWTRVDGTVQGQ
jgi:photosystem II stability/assembly factor-like uncharacterized protein